ncbi:membrane-bound PQQ-dependent dehydrogenase, glucose/quinate/shikimate family [Salinicola avicenniae]|uniref:membrane-bound PQQ-dependent dehydrogenase, glucose/quinate/shikimate family n=1 Tax=Salinicola avicenniae TaxID=2916836 RepID=UPI002074AB2D|nr:MULTISPECIES: membrane-bound PQQ-dependent dehydrogenase, glucose/quinate/shikimate family [unclassified Salinicola]
MTREPSGAARKAVALVGIVLFAIGLLLAIGGARLALLGGSLYYLIAGAVLLLAGALLFRRRPLGAVLFFLYFVATLIWALAEAGLAYWPLMPRLGIPLVLCVPVLLSLPTLFPGRGVIGRPAVTRTLAGATAVFCAVLIAFAFEPHGMITPDEEALTAEAGGSLAQPQWDEWRSYAQSPTGVRYATADQITPDNVDELEVAWTFRTGDIPQFPYADQATPLEVGGVVYTCTPTSQVFALDADSGEPIWHHDPKSRTISTHPRCRGVGYFDADTADNIVPPEAAADGVSMTPAIAERLADASCAQRILLTTNDARLQAIDAKTGELCEAFGDGGTVNLQLHLDNPEPDWYTATSAPAVFGNLVIVGGWVSDGIHRGAEPSGVVRAFNVETGALVWAWDAGDPDTHGLPPNGEYTHDSPNMWSHPSYDEELGLLYMPVGGTIPDYWGVGRNPESEKRATSVVAVDIATGHERWVFQTVHHDLWDYDVSPTPALYDIPDGDGGTIPALAQATKMGEIFLLDRRTGEPLTEVEEVPVPQTTVPDEQPSPTQPVSTGMPRIGGGSLSETDMWGMTMFDQLACRIQFNELHYEGSYTPTSTQKTLHYPGVLGGMNWGGVAINPTKDYLLVNDIRIGQLVEFLPREEADAFEASHSGGQAEGLDYMPARDTPYGINRERFVSPLGVPCNTPPFGTLTAIDLKTQKIAWQRPMGTVEETGPLGLRTGLPIPLGMPTLGGAMTTQSGLVFYAGTLDFYLRAFDINTGEEVWKAPLPVGAQATPMTYTSPETGRQYVVVSAGGASGSAEVGDYVIAYALSE